MPYFVQFPASPALGRRVAAVREATRPGSRLRAGVNRDLFVIVVDDHRDKLLRSVDRHGKPLAPLAASTLANPKRGPGPALIPRGAASRFITNFVASWQGQAGQETLVGRLVGIVNQKGQSFAQYHLTGAGRLPRRDVGGISPKGWARIKARWEQFARDVVRYGGRP